MADTPFGGVEQVEWDAAGNNFGAPNDVGELHADTSFEPDYNDEDQTPQEENVHSGQFINGTVVFFDLSKVSALKTKMKDLERIDVRGHFPNDSGGTETMTFANVLPQRVRKEVRASQAGRRNVGIFEFRAFTTDIHDFD